MKSTDIAGFLKKMGDLGEEEVRSRLDRNLYSRHEAPLVRDWLRLEVTRSSAERSGDQKNKTKRRSNISAKFSSVVPVVALVVSIASFRFSYVTYRDAHHDTLLLRATRSHRDYPAVFQASSFPPADSADLITYWDVLLVNNGEQAVSVLKLDIRVLTPQGPVFYTGLVDAILDNQLRPTSAPWSLDPGKPLQLVARLRLHIAPEAYAQLAKVIPDRAGSSLRSVELLLADKQLDLWGDPITPLRHGSKTSGFQVESEVNQPSISFIAETARGAKVNDVAFWYPSLKEFSMR
jgi:hypothetical protein